MSRKVAFDAAEAKILSTNGNEEIDGHVAKLESTLSMPYESDIEHNEEEEEEEEEEEKEKENLTYKNSQWYLFGQILPKNEVIFICQVVILYIVILTCIVNLSLKNGDSNLWTALLSSSLGIMLPQPTLSKKKS